MEGVQAGSGQSEETLIQMAFSIFELRPAASGQQSRQLKESERERGEQRREECNLTNERRAGPPLFVRPDVPRASLDDDRMAGASAGASAGDDRCDATNDSVDAAPPPPHPGQLRTRALHFFTRLVEPSSPHLFSNPNLD